MANQVWELDEPRMTNLDEPAYSQLSNKSTHTAPNPRVVRERGGIGRRERRDKGEEGGREEETEGGVIQPSPYCYNDATIDYST